MNLTAANETMPLLTMLVSNVHGKQEWVGSWELWTRRRVYDVTALFQCRAPLLTIVAADLARASRRIQSGNYLPTVVWERITCLGLALWQLMKTVC